GSILLRCTSLLLARSGLGGTSAGLSASLIGRLGSSAFGLSTNSSVDVAHGLLAQRAPGSLWRTAAILRIDARPQRDASRCLTRAEASPLLPVRRDERYDCRKFCRNGVTAVGEALAPGRGLMAMTRSPITRLLFETVRFLLGLVALAALTALCFWLDFGLVSTAFTYLILIVVLSLAVAFIPLVVLSFIAVGCLNLFFAPPIFSFRVDYPADIITIAAFLITSLIVTSLVRRTRAAKDELANVVDGIPALIWNTSPDGPAAFSNQRFRDYTGFSPEQLRDWGWMNALHPEDRKVEAWRAAFAAGESFENEVRIRSANGEHRWFVLRMMPLRNEQGTIVKWHGTA